MSGTSADGIDAVLVNIDAREEITVVATHRHSYPPPVTAKVEHVISGSTTSLHDLARLDVELGIEFAAAAAALLHKHQVKPKHLAAIGSHGQTVGHFPEPPFPVTVQLGCPAVIAEQTGVRTVADFRMGDMATGGQGAPLAPAFHRAAFSSDSETRVIVNIGGIANLTLLPSDPAATIIGFDTGPGNTLLDAWVRRERGLRYDPQGEWAESGTVDTDLLATLLRDPYLRAAPPKSTGRERFNLGWLESLLKMHTAVSAVDVQATLTRFTARTIADALVALAPDTAAVYLCGGGVHNQTLVQALRNHLPGRRIADTQALGMHPDWVEAVAFAWLAHRRLHNRPGNLPSVTGARHEAVLGALWEGNGDK